MDAPVVSRLLLAVPATLILALLLEHIRRNHGGRLALTYAVACAAYGLVRGGLVKAISDAHGVPMPYRMADTVRVGAVSPMEIAGWMLAAALAWLAGAAMVRVLGSAPGTEPPHRIALVGALVMAALSLAVETAAIAAGWWTWSIPPPPDVFMRVPQIAMVDWGFVAFDFLLPFLLLTGRGTVGDRVAALLLFPLHFGSHYLLDPLVPSVPLSMFELAHYGIPLWVFWRAVEETSPQGSGPERVWAIPGAAALLVAADTALATRLAGHDDQMIFIVPLALVGVAALVLARPGVTRGGAAAATPAARTVLRAAAVAIAVGLVLFVRLPANRRRDGYARNFIDGAARLNAGQVAEAEALLREAVRLRPDKAEPHLVLALALYRLERKPESALQLDEALRLRPSLAESHEAKVLSQALGR